MHGMKNMSHMGILWMRQWSSQIRKRRVIHSNMARHGLLFCETWRSHTGVHEDYALSTGEGLRTFRWNMAPSSQTVGPEDGELTRRQGEMSQMTWIFTNTAVRISQPTVPKLNQHCITSQKGADLIYTTFKVWNEATVEVLCFLLSACEENA